MSTIIDKTKSNIKWGIVSTGRIAQQFVDDMQYVSGSEVVAVAARREEDAKTFAT
ncbi:hypothetical protein [Aestuariibacter sp. A3R04]|uniref:hypothetical protein n=1 Tax=Aestuariibacter sp. A3R04 TaxID=2841571 RepID=UPI001C09EDAB|nr:hypothetical protein [Aestuariibacter sp. A3R04]MBU3021663.1 hypothetical protein [Aestuariibacter sp. A3R04]